MELMLLCFATILLIGILFLGMYFASDYVVRDSEPEWTIPYEDRDSPNILYEGTHSKKREQGRRAGTVSAPATGGSSYRDTAVVVDDSMQVFTNLALIGLLDGSQAPEQPPAPQHTPSPSYHDSSPQPVHDTGGSWDTGSSNSCSSTSSCSSASSCGGSGGGD